MIEYFDKCSDHSTYFPEPRLLINPGTFKGSMQELRELGLKQIEDYPESFDMDTWAKNSLGWEEISTPTPEWAQKAGEGTASCGTTMCIAGYVQLFTDGKIEDNVESRAKDALGLENTSLFYMSNENARRELERLVHEGQSVNA